MTKETEVIPAPEPIKVSSEREEVETEIVETVELAPADIEDVINDQDDPRAEIYKRHGEKRITEIEASAEQFSGENTEINTENDELPVETDDSGDIIKPTHDQSATSQDVEMVNVKIRGDVRSVPKSKVDAQGGVENYQIRIAAQEQMEQNAHERAANEARTLSLDARERQQAERTAAIPAMDSQTGQDPDRSTQLDGQNLEEMARQYQEAVYDDAEGAPSILANMVKTAAQTGQQTFDEVKFRKQVKEDVLADQRQAKIVKASHELIKAHPELNQRDVAFDPRMYSAIDSETNVVEREHVDWEPSEVVQEAYKRIQKWKGLPQPETMSEKQAQKREMNRPRVGSQRFQPPPPAPRASNSDYVAATRKARGQEI